MQPCPGLRSLDLLQAFALDPAKQALNAGMTFHIGRAILRTALLRLVVVTLQAEVEFQPLAKLAQPLFNLPQKTSCIINCLQGK